MATLASPTLQSLISGVRVLLSQPDRNNSFWSDDELAKYLNDAINIYFLEVSLNREGLFTTTTDLNISSTSDLVALPGDFFEIRTLWRKTSTGYVACPYRNRVDEGYTNIATSGGDAYVPSYYLRQNSIVLRPPPTFSEVAGLKLEYVQFPDTMVFGGDSMTNQVSPVFKQLIEMYAVYKAKFRESLVNGTNLYQPAKDNMNDVYKLFKEAIEQRSYGPTFVKPFNPETEGF